MPPPLDNPEPLRGNGGPDLALTSRAVVDLEGVPVPCVTSEGHIRRLLVRCCFRVLVAHL